MAAGGILAFIGSGVFEMAKQEPNLGDLEAFRQSTRPAERPGVPVFALAMGVALVGFAFCFIGVSIQVAAGRRTKEVDRRYPLPPGWGGPRQEED